MADSGIELIEVPPEIWPTFSVVRVRIAVRPGVIGAVRIRSASSRVHLAKRDRPRRAENRIRSARVSPRVAARPGDRDAEPPAGERARDHSRRCRRLRAQLPRRCVRPHTGSP